MRKLRPNGKVHISSRNVPAALGNCVPADDSLRLDDDDLGHPVRSCRPEDSVHIGRECLPVDRSEKPRSIDRGFFLVLHR